MGADHDIHRAVRQPRLRGADLGRGAEAAQDLDAHRVAEEALHRGLVVLLGQDRGRDQDRRLQAVQHALHHGAEGDLGLAVAHVAAEQAVHRGGRFHVPLDLLDAAELVPGLRVAEGVLELRLPGAVRREGVARTALALGVEPDQLARHLLRRGLGPGLGAGPVAAAQPVQLHGPVLARADILAHQVELGRGHVEGVGPGVGDLHVVLVRAVHLHLHDADEAPDPVVLVDHQIAGF